MIFIAIFLALILASCESVESKNKVIYEDRTPVMKARVIQWNDDTRIETLTDVNGTWAARLIVGTEWNLCIEDPKNDNTLCCYEGLLAVNEDGNLKDVN